MSSRKTHRLSRRAALLGLGATAGCGFAPAFVPGGAGDILQGAVEVTAPQTIMGATLRDRLRERLGIASQSRFSLATSLQTRSRAATITPDGDTTRLDIIGTSDWTLTEVATGVTRTGNVQTFTSYSATGSTVATQSAQSDAEARLATALADLITAQLIIVAGDFGP